MQWITEQDERSGSAIGYRVTEKLADVRSEYQHIEVYATTDWGNLMVIDGCFMLTTRDNFLYHEVMAHAPLFTHDNPQDVVIVGGGDCGTLAEVVKHEGVTSVTQVEIDAEVTRLSEQFFPELCVGNSDPRATLLFADAVHWMREAADSSADVIIVDSTDPIGPGEGLFNKAFYQQCRRVLRDGGLLLQQGESPLVHSGLHHNIHKAMADAGFEQTQSLLFPQPCYPSGWWSGVLAGDVKTLAAYREADARAKSFKTRYYNADIHKALIAQPESWPL